MFNEHDILNAAQIMSENKGSMWVDVGVIKNAAFALPKIEGVRFLRSVWPALTLRSAEAALTIIKGGKA